MNHSVYETMQSFTGFKQIFTDAARHSMPFRTINTSRAYASQKILRELASKLGEMACNVAKQSFNYNSFHSVEL